MFGAGLADSRFPLETAQRPLDLALTGAQLARTGTLPCVGTTDVIALIALIVSIGAGAAAIVALVLQFRESHRRDEELELLRRQVETQQEDRRRHEHAQLSFFAGVTWSKSDVGIEYQVSVQNVGEAVASEVSVELVDGTGATVGKSALIPSLVAGEKAFTGVLTPSTFTGPYEVFFEWKDGRTARQRAASGQLVGAPRASRSLPSRSAGFAEA